MSRLSSSIENIKNHYTVVVIGSGYGGAISASRLARAGQSVCVLERGKEFQPGEYPDTEGEFLSESQVHLPDGQTIGSPTGLYDFRMNSAINTLIGCGLGGTSLINANVALRPDLRVFEDTHWPKAFRSDVNTMLADGFTRAEEMLKPTLYPSNFPELPKLEAHQKSATAFGADKFKRLPINVTFTDGLNHVNVHQERCKLCGDCMTGCNYHAKNTVLMNYLPDAKNHGAEIYTQIAVRYLERKDNRWLVHYQLLGEDRDLFDAPDLFVSANIVILGAGTLGSTEILLRSKAVGLPLSSKLGERFSGNGDVLGFAYNNDTTVNMVGFGNRPPHTMDPVGPTITSVIDLRDQPDWKDGIVIEEGGVAGAIGKYLPQLMSTMTKVVGRDTDLGITDLIAEKARELDSLIRGPYVGAIKNTQVFLVMSHDSSNGELYLDDQDELRITWPGVGEEQFAFNAKEKMEIAARELGGTFIENPVWSQFETHNLVTAHPLGGCAMGDNAKSGVVNHKGQVFSDVEGTEVYEGLYVNDGAIIPRSLGANPHITIAAVAERNCALMIKDYGWQIDYDLAPPPLVPVESTHPGIKFTEALDGFFSTKVKDNYERGAQQGEADGSALRFVVTIISDDVGEMMRNPNHKAKLIGTATAPALSSEVLTATEGEFQLFTRDPNSPDMKLIIYRMKLTSKAGEVFFLEGLKYVHDDTGFDLWDDMTILYITIYQGENNQGLVIGKGILTMKSKDLQQQMRTIQVTNTANMLERLKILARFGRFLVGDLADTYGGVFTRPNIFNPDAPPRKKRPLRVDSPEVYSFKTTDGVKLRLTRFQGGKKGPVILAHGLGVSSLIFSTDLVETNLVEYLSTYGYDVWLLDYRSSIELPYATTQYTADDVAMYDWPAAVKTVLDLTGASTIQVVVHCYGAITFNMAILNGLEGVRSAVCSQVGSHLSIIPANKIKSGIHLDEFLKLIGVESLTTYTDTHDDWLDRLYNKALKAYPLVWEERCNSPVCHRITFVYAPLFEHDQLNDLTHDNLHELFGIASISNFEHLNTMVRAKQIVNAEGADVYLPHIERMAIPIAFIHGEENKTWTPESTRQTFNLLCEKNGKELYSRYLIPHYGHIDCIFGKNASRDVYPLIRKHLDAT